MAMERSILALPIIGNVRFSNLVNFLKLVVLPIKWK